VENMVNS